MAQQQPSSPPPMTPPFLDTPPPSDDSSPPPMTSPFLDTPPPSGDSYLFYNGHNFELSDVPKKIMFFRNGSWHDFKGKTLETLCNCFAEGFRMIRFCSKGYIYTFDLCRMLQVHHDSALMRSIAWIDKQDRAFFPIQSLDADFDEMDETRKIHVEGGATSNNGGGPVFPNTKLLSNTDKAYLFTKNLILSSLAKVDPDAVVMDIHEFQISGSYGRSWWNAFEKQIEITEAARGKPNVVYALCAAPKDKVASILSHGFELSRYKQAPQAAGVFLADLGSPEYSALQYPYYVAQENEQHIILCRVVLGSVEKMQLKLQQTCPSREEFDTASNDPKNPIYHVVWGNDMNKRIFPECVITCKTSAFKTVVYGSDYKIENSHIPQLMLGLRKGIPLAHVPILDDIYDRFKNDRRIIYEPTTRACWYHVDVPDICKDDILMGKKKMVIRVITWRTLEVSIFKAWQRN